MYKDTLRDIRQQCVKGMNGIASTSMRQKGLNYKVNFGLSIPQIKELAHRYQPDKGLAEALWQEETRELKILATLLYPANQYRYATADVWNKQITNQEIREQLCINLLQHLSYAEDLSLDWSNNTDANIRITGYWLLARLLLMKKATTVITAGSLTYIYNDSVAENLFVRNAAHTVLKQIGRQQKDEADHILDKLSEYKDSLNPIEQEAYNSLAFEFDFFFGS